MFINNLMKLNNIINSSHLRSKELLNSGSEKLILINEKMDRISDTISEEAVIPLLGWGYHALGNLSEKISAVFSEKRPIQIRKMWTDPFSSEILLKMFIPIENFSKHHSIRTPTKNRYFHFLDQCFVSAAQGLYAYISEVNSILRLPGNLKNAVKKMDIDYFLNHVLKRGGGIFSVVSKILFKTKQVACFLLNVAIKVSDLVLQMLFVMPHFEFFEYIRENIEAVQQKIKNKFSKIAIKEIEKRETRIRKDIVASAASYSTWYSTTLANRILLKSGIGLISYGIAESVLNQGLGVPTLPLKMIAVSSTAYLLWKNVYQPYLQEYYDAYNPEFDPNRSYLADFLKRYYLDYLYFPLEAAKHFFQHEKQDVQPLPTGSNP